MARRAREAEIEDLWLRFRSFNNRRARGSEKGRVGLPNQQIATQLAVAENTVKVHRSRTIEKMQAQSLPESVKMIERLDAYFALRDTG